MAALASSNLFCSLLSRSHGDTSTSGSSFISGPNGVLPRRSNFKYVNALFQNNIRRSSQTGGPKRVRAPLPLGIRSSGVETFEVYEMGELERPPWAGDQPLSRFINFLISIRPLYGFMKIQARNVLIGTAEKNGIEWRKVATELISNPRLAEIKESIENKNLVYPSYYLQEFHAYESGNLCWEAAGEVESATKSMCLRAIPFAPNVERAIAILRGGWLAAIRKCMESHADSPLPQNILDIGCSVGISTRFLADAFPHAHVTGLDASPYYLSVAILREEENKNQRNEIKYIHALAEDSKFPDDHFDLVSIAYVFHECPQSATLEIMKEAKRILKPGGILAITDNSPRSKIFQSLPAPIFTLMKSTEPWVDQFFKLDLERAAKELGFENVKTVLSDPRHQTVTGTA